MDFCKHKADLSSRLETQRAQGMHHILGPPEYGLYWITEASYSDWGSLLTPYRIVLSLLLTPYHIVLSLLLTTKCIVDYSVQDSRPPGNSFFEVRCSPNELRELETRDSDEMILQGIWAYDEAAIRAAANVFASMQPQPQYLGAKRSSLHLKRWSRARIFSRYWRPSHQWGHVLWWRSARDPCRERGLWRWFHHYAWARFTGVGISYDLRRTLDNSCEWNDKLFSNKV